MSKFDYDFFVVGAGSGGVRAARIAAGYGARVGIAEAAYLGGTCVNVGCVPKKLLVYASEYSHHFRDAHGFGYRAGEPAHDFSSLIEAKDREIRRLNGVYERLLRDASVDLLWGRAKLLDRYRLEIEGRTVSAEYILLAPGSRPQVPDIPGQDLAVTSNEVFFLPKLPPHVLIVGGGYIAVEFAGVFQGLGAQVTIAYRGDCVLRGFDEDIRQTLSEELRKAGIGLRYGVMPLAIAAEGEERVVTWSDGGTTRANAVIMATGRVPNVVDLGLPVAGVETDEGGAIRVDSFLRTSTSNIFAAGDVTDRITLTPMAIAEGQAVAMTLFGKTPTEPDYANVPSAVFSQPPVGTVGLTEAEARAQHADIRIFRSRFRPLKHTLSGRDQCAMMKLVVNGSDDRVLGCHMVGPEAGEVIQGFAVALKCGATKAQFNATIGIHPTSAEEFVTMRTPVTG